MPPTLFFGQGERDQYTLRRVVELRLAVAFECKNCRHLSQFDVLDLIDRHGLSTKLGDLRRRARCTYCKKRVAEILLQQPGIRGGRSWWPHPPRATRD